MTSHLYFWNAQAEPQWHDDSAPPLDAISVARRRRIADEMLAAVAGSYDTGFPRAHVDWWIELSAPAMSIFVYDDHVHITVRARSVHEHVALGLTRNLNLLAELLHRIAGYDFFEHGCQGLGRRGNLDAVPYVLGSC